MGVIRPLLNRIMIPIGPGAPGEVLVGMEDEVDVDTVEVQEGESLEDIKAKLKPKNKQYQLICLIPRIHMMIKLQS